ncbi:MAG: hypothetical protein IPI60_05850 [Saprospiraceae bacterium]|nr:hypothetical protein [Saprospiraceae bacterium]
MKLQFTLILILLVPVAGFTQMNSSWDIIAGVDYSNSILFAQRNTGLRNVAGVMNDSQQGKLNWRLGGNYNMRVGSNAFFKTGIRLASVGYVYANDNLTWGSEHNGMGGHSPDPDLPHSARFSFDYWFIEIPVAFRFERGNDKFSTYFEAGVSPSIYILSRQIIKIDNDKTIRFSQGNQFHQFNIIHLVGTFAWGINYNISERVQLFAQPTLRFHLTPIADSPIEEYLYNVGLEMGTRWKI